MIFDGRLLANKIEEELKWKIDQLPRKPRLVVILDINHAGSVVYTNLKEKLARRLDIEFIRGETSRIAEYNMNDKIDGIIIQLPYPNSQNLINLINPKKDVDGLREDSPFKPAAVRAVFEILNSNIKILDKRILVIGSQGFTGKKLVKEFKCDGMDKDDFDLEKIKSADVVISATGQPGLIKSDMVKDGVVAVDLGYPTGDFAPEVADKASFFTPVPGGVGPVTVAMLFQNLLDSMHG